MNQTQLQPVGELLVQSYLDTAAYSRRFSDEYGSPPTVAANAHHMRSVAQVFFDRHDRYELDTEYAALGRLGFTDKQDGQVYVVRSESAVAIEKGRPERYALFDSSPYLKSKVRLLAYSFHFDGLDLSVAGTQQRNGSRRLTASDTPVYVGTWPYVITDGAPPFDQGPGEAFDEIGDIGDVEGSDRG